MRQKSLRMKTGNNQDALRFFTNSKMSLGPRMGSNYPPKERSGKLTNNHLFNSLRPKVPQAAIPTKSTSFQACIMPMSVSHDDDTR